MYSPKVVEARLAQIKDRKWVRLDVEESIDRADSLARLWDEEGGKLRRGLTTAELAHIESERLVCALDFEYCITRYAWIKVKEVGMKRVERLWASQAMALRRVADLQEKEQVSKSGIYIALLKARQLGLSTLVDLMLIHKAIFSRGFNALLAADVMQQSTYLYNIIERFYANLPWWLKPHCEYHTKDKGMFFDKLDSLITVDHGNRPRVEGRTRRKDIGRGSTTHFAHLSELETWASPEQIYVGLLPSIPRKPGIMAFFESTGQFRNSDWHRFCLDALNGASIFTLIFVPWYIEPTECRQTPPEGWEPSEITLAHAKSVERTSPRWMEGRTVHLDRDQLYFYEITRKMFASRGKLGTFLCEFTSDPSEAFRSLNASMLDLEVVEWLDAQTSYPKAWEVTGPFINQAQIRGSQDMLIEQSKMQFGS